MQFKKPTPPKRDPIGVRKVTVSLPPSVVDDLDLISSSVGLSRSALLSSVLSESLPALKSTVVTLVGLSNPNGSDASQQRYNSSSKDAINDYIRKITSGGQDDLFNGK